MNLFVCESNSSAEKKVFHSDLVQNILLQMLLITQNREKKKREIFAAIGTHFYLNI